MSTMEKLATAVSADTRFAYACPTSTPTDDPAGYGLVGCGRSFESGDDGYGDGWVDCPHCGLCFDPMHVDNAATDSAVAS